MPALADAEVSRVSFPAVDIAITNLDSIGDPIGGETVTAVAAFTYQQPLIRLPKGDPPSLQVLTTFLRLLKRAVVSRAAPITHTDYGSEGDILTQLSEHPSIGVRMEIQDDREYGYFDNEPTLFDVGGGNYEQYKLSKTVMYLFTLTISAGGEDGAQLEAIHMVDALIGLVIATPWLIVPSDPTYPLQTGNNKYPLEWVTMPTQIGSANRTNITAYNAQLRVRGVPIILDDPSTKNIKQITTIKLTTTDMSAANPVEVTV